MPVSTDNEPRVKWSEEREVSDEKELFLIIGEMTDSVWRFYERSTWEVTWHDIPATSERIAKAQQLLAAQASITG